jgi:Nucleoside-diphosphate-sugar pyrophosphorylase involved in lipopolysaccharide biosynthesis/translation initiation factor 2B, gamma/epsilon subunits (eIF-2Bgamma/eIF-2Bepsilon)
VKAVVLAGGFGTRLQSVVKDLPKPMAPVGGGCFLDYLLKGLITGGIREYIFCVHHLADKIMDYLGDGGGLGISVRYSREPKPMGTAGAVGLLKDDLKETFCVVNADTYLEADLREFLAWHREKKALATLCAVKVPDSGRFGSLGFDSRWRITDFREKAAAGGDQWVNGGIYMFEPEIFHYIPEETPVSMEREVFPRLLKSNGGIYVYPRETHFFDIGVPEDYHAFQKFISRRSAEGDI